MNETRYKCAVCNNILHNIFSIEKVPIKAICVENYTNNYSDKLSFSKCVLCNTIQLDKMIPLHILYSDSHNVTSVGNVWKKYFDLFLEKLQPLIQNRHVFEIGCPSGKIAMNASGFEKYYIVDPNKNDNVNFNEKHITFIKAFFDKDFVCDARVDVIVHSHLFEHIYEPNIFLQKCYEVLHDDGEMLFGVPNMSNFIDSKNCPFLGVFFEHTIFLNVENITFLLEKNGFEVIEIIYYEKHSVIYHCKKQKKIQENDNVNFTESNAFKIINYLEEFNESYTNYNQYIQSTNMVLAETNKKVYIFGAGYNSQILLAIGVDVTYITGILDNCMDKQGKYLYGFKLMIFSPQVLAKEDCIVVLKNGYYCEEIKRQIININPNTLIIC